MPPGVVNEQFGIDPEQAVQQSLVVKIPGAAQRATRHVSHGVQAVGLQALGISSSHPPKIREGAVIP